MYKEMTRTDHLRDTSITQLIITHTYSTLYLQVNSLFDTL